MFAWNRIPRQSFSFIFFAIILAGCGGGTGTTPAEPTLAPEQQAAHEAIEQPVQQIQQPSEPAPEVEQPITVNIGQAEDFGPFNDFTLQAKSAYTGSDVERGLSKDGAAQFLTNALFGIPKDSASLSTADGGQFSWVAFSWDELLDLPQAEIDGLGISMPQPGSRDCYLQGKAGSIISEYSQSTPVNGYSNWKYDLTYSRCPRSANAIFDGRVLVDYERHSPSGRVRNLFMAFDNMVFDINGHEFEVNGTVKWAEPRQCELIGAKTYFLNVRDLETGQSIFLENVKTALVGASVGYCERERHAANHFSGRILNSDFGAVSLSTPSPMQITIPTLNAPWSTTIAIQQGALVLNSANDSARFSLSTYNPDGIENRSSNNYIKVATLTLDSDLYSQSETYSQVVELFTAGGLLDLEDDDADGMNNSWERLSGLNPENPDDQSSDYDGDGRTAEFEFQHLGVANSLYAFGDTIDRRIELTFSGSTGAISTHVSINLHSGIVGTLYSDSEHMVSLSASKAGSWSYGDSDCSISANDNVLSCSRTEKDRYPVSIKFTPVSDGQIAFYANTEVPDKDYDPTNNSATISTVFEKKRSDIELSATEFVITQKNTDGSVWAHIQQPFGSHRVPVEVTITYPSELTILSAKFSFYHPNYLNSCEISDVVVCNTQSIQSGEVMSIQLEYLATEPGDFAINWEVSPVQYEEVFDNNTATSQLRVMSHTSELQPIVDSAYAGDEIILPPGDYLGELNLRQKQLTIQGALGETPTTFYTVNRYDKSIFNVGQQSVIKNVHFKNRGTPILYDTGDYLTVEGSVFEPLPEVMADPGKSIYGNKLINTDDDGVSGRAVHLRFFNNLVAGYGASENSGCSSLLQTIGWKSMIVDHNTFDNLNCSYGVLTGERHWGGDSIISESTYIGNNTFNSISNLIGHYFYAPYSYYLHETRLENNILSNVDTFIIAPSLNYYIDSANKLITSNNMIYDSERDHVIPNVMLTDKSGVVETIDRQGDPQYADAQNGDFTLLPLSAAIDVGIEPTIDLSGFSYNSSIDRVDGLQNGLVQPDIGAHEFQ